MITKIEAAEKQLDTAIRLFFENIDHLSSYTLAAASREITDDLCEKQKYELFQQKLIRISDTLKIRLSFREEMRIYIKDEYYKEAMRAFKKRQNFLKHINNHSGQEMNDLAIRELSVVILWAIKNFTSLQRRITPAMSIFLCWFDAAEPKFFRYTGNTHNNFFKSTDGLRNKFQNLYGHEAFKAMRDCLKEFYQSAI